MKLTLAHLWEIPPEEWPEGSEKIVVETLRDPAAAENDLCMAAELAGEFVIVDEGALSALLSIVATGERSVGVRARAASSLAPALEHASFEAPDEPIDLRFSAETIARAQETLRQLFSDTATPKELRRRALEASVHASEDWHRQALLDAYASDDPEWKLTAVFGMRHIRGFDRQILDALENEDPEILCEAVIAAGAWEIAEAWEPIEDILLAGEIDKALLLAAIDATAGIRPDDAEVILGDFLESDDDEIVDAAYEAIAIAQIMTGKVSEDLDEDLDDEFDDEDEDFDDDEDEEEDDDEEEDEEER
jgi:hypothetical protein